MKDRYGNIIKIGCKIKAPIIGETDNHLLYCNGNFKIDLSEPVTVYKDDRGVLMAGSISLSSYKNRLIEVVNAT